MKFHQFASLSIHSGIHPYVHPFIHCVFNVCYYYKLWPISCKQETETDAEEIIIKGSMISHWYYRMKWLTKNLGM